jgi:hypothetical protein
MTDRGRCLMLSCNNNLRLLVVDRLRWQDCNNQIEVSSVLESDDVASSCVRSFITYKQASKQGYFICIL